MIQIDIPMPRCCDECFAFGDSWYYPYCYVLRQQLEFAFESDVQRMPTCPIKEPAIAQAILLGESETWGYWFKCSACGYERIHESAKNFCPNCGAKLESESND